MPKRVTGLEDALTYAPDQVERTAPVVTRPRVTSGASSAMPSGGTHVRLIRQEHKCGHPATAKETREKTAERIAESLCTDCYATYEPKNRESAETCLFLGLRPLTGSKRQIDWANNIRAKFFPALTWAMNDISHSARKQKWSEWDAQVEDFAASLKIEAVAGWWIGCRDNLELVISAVQAGKPDERNTCGHPRSLLRICEEGYVGREEGLCEVCLAQIKAQFDKPEPFSSRADLPTLTGSHEQIGEACWVRAKLIDDLYDQLMGPEYGTARNGFYLHTLLYAFQRIAEAEWWIAMKMHQDEMEG